MITESKDYNWTEWRGGKRPVDRNVMVAVKLRSGVESVNYAWAFGWSHGVDYQDDIVSYCRVAQDSVIKPISYQDGPEHIWTNPPTIEQLAAGYRNKLDLARRAQEEADSFRCGAEAALERLELACAALGLEVKPAS